MKNGLIGGGKIILWGLFPFILYLNAFPLKIDERIIEIISRVALWRLLQISRFLKEERLKFLEKGRVH